MTSLGTYKNYIYNFFNKSTFQYPIESTINERNIIKECKPYTMTSHQRLWSTISATKYIVKNNIQGDLVECGVWRGGSTMAMTMTLISLNTYNRKFFLFDTFEGMTLPSKKDVDILGVKASQLLKYTSKNSNKGNNIWCVASLDDVKNNLKKTNYPTELIRYVQGDVIDTLDIEYNIPDCISLLRLDTDWYESTKKELEILFPRLTRGGICLIDDYGHWQGARQAVDEYFQANGLYPFLNIVDYTGRVFIKC